MYQGRVAQVLAVQTPEDPALVGPVLHTAQKDPVRKEGVRGAGVQRHRIRGPEGAVPGVAALEEVVPRAAASKEAVPKEAVLREATLEGRVPRVAVPKSAISKGAVPKVSVSKVAVLKASLFKAAAQRKAANGTHEADRGGLEGDMTPTLAAPVPRARVLVAQVLKRVPYLAAAKGTEKLLSTSSRGSTR